MIMLPSDEMTDQQVQEAKDHTWRVTVSGLGTVFRPTVGVTREPGKSAGRLIFERGKQLLELGASVGDDPANGPEGVWLPTNGEWFYCACVPPLVLPFMCVAEWEVTDPGKLIAVVHENLYLEAP